jgi:hypothetical protein
MAFFTCPDSRPDTSMDLLFGKPIKRLGRSEHCFILAAMPLDLGSLNL